MSLLMCFLCLEIGLRIWGPDYHRVAVGRPFERENLDGGIVLFKDVFEYHSNPRGYFDVRREEDKQIIYGVELRSAGSRAAGSPARRIPEHMDSPADVLAFLTRQDKVLALGDSFTLGQGVRFEDTYVRRLEKLLAKEGMPITIRNTGVRGFGLEDVCDTYRVYSARRDYPVVIYGFVLDDFGLPDMESLTGCDYIDANNDQDMSGPWRRHYASINFIHHCLDRIRLDHVTKNAYRQAFHGENAGDKFRLLKGLDRKIQSDGGKLVIVLFPLLHEFDDYPFQEIHDKIHGCCRENDILLLDLLPAFRQHTAESLWVHPTDYHPNEIAHHIAAEEVLSFLQDHGVLEALDVR